MIARVLNVRRWVPLSGLWKLTAPSGTSKDGARQGKARQVRQEGHRDYRFAYFLFDFSI
ncbi:hypothetical protein IC575_015290 [Cucumis melo]